jgi:hypothetical protein
MAALSRLGKQIEELIRTLNSAGALFALIVANHETLNMDEVREYFRLFDKELLLQELIG